MLDLRRDLHDAPVNRVTLTGQLRQLLEQHREALIGNVSRTGGVRRRSHVSIIAAGSDISSCSDRVPEPPIVGPQHVPHVVRLQSVYCSEVARLRLKAYLAEVGRGVPSRCVALQRYGDSLTFRGEREPDNPSPPVPVVVVSDIELAQSDSELPPVDNFRRVRPCIAAADDLADDRQPLV